MMNRARKAFTLLELIVVIVVLGILALIAVPTFSTIIGKSEAQVAESTAGAIARHANALAAFDVADTGVSHVTAAAADTTPGNGMTIADDGLGKVTVQVGGADGAEACVEIVGTIADVTDCA